MSSSSDVADVAALTDALDLETISVPTRGPHGEHNPIVPIANLGDLSSELIPGAQYKTYPGYLHGMQMTHGVQIDPDLLAFVQS